MAPDTEAMFFNPHVLSDTRFLRQALSADKGAPSLRFRGMTPLHVAAFSGLGDSVTVLSEHGADVDARNDHGAAALHMAAMAEGGLDSPAYARAVNALIAAGSDVGAVDDQGNTPLHVACRFGHVQAAFALMAAGARGGIRNHVGERPLDMVPAAALERFVAPLRESQSPGWIGVSAPV